MPIGAQHIKLQTPQARTQNSDIYVRKYQPLSVITISAKLVRLTDHNAFTPGIPSLQAHPHPGHTYNPGIY